MGSAEILLLMKWTEPSAKRKSAPLMRRLPNARRWALPVPFEGGLAGLSGLMPGPGPTLQLAELTLDRTPQTAPQFLTSSRSPTRMVLLEPSGTLWMLSALGVLLASETPRADHLAVDHIVAHAEVLIVCINIRP